MSSIFSKSKYSENKNNNVILNLEDIIKTIPPDAVSIPNISNKTRVEWRWRFFNFKGRKLIEISKKHPEEKRLYAVNGKWIKSDIDEIWDKYVTNVKYYYTDE